MTDQPTIVCLCGSTRFGKTFERVMLEETLNGKIVLTVGCMTQSDSELGARITPEVKEKLDELHKKKIEMANEIFVINCGGYIGSSTKGEIYHAMYHHKPIRFLEKYSMLLPGLDFDQTLKKAAEIGLIAQLEAIK